MLKKSDIDYCNAEERDHIRFNPISRFGKSICQIKCPFCGEIVTAYIWSLAGSGKKCVCGAIHYNNRKTKKIKQV